MEPISLLEFRQEELPLINKKFDDVQSEIELLATVTEDQEEAEIERDEFERNYFAARSQIQEIVNSERPQTSSGHDLSVNSPIHSGGARLVPID